MGHDKQSRRDDGPSSRVIHEVPLTSNLDRVLRLLVDALNSPAGNQLILEKLVDLPFIKEELSIVHRLVAAGTGGDNGPVLIAINNLNRKVDEFMATQEERLQAILVAVKTVKEMLAELKANNPAIEDEIKAIEDELAPAPEPEPTPEV